MEYHRHASSSGLASLFQASGLSPVHRATVRRLLPRAYHATSQRRPKSMSHLFFLYFPRLHALNGLFPAWARGFLCPPPVFHSISGGSVASAFFFRARATSTLRVPQFLALAPECQAAPIFPTRTSFPKPARAIFLCSVHNFPSHPDCLGLGTHPSPRIFTYSSWHSVYFFLYFHDGQALPYDDADESSLCSTQANNHVLADSPRS